jgi:hypothetical protein
VLSSSDAVIYRYGFDYVVILAFAADGSIARISMEPEALLFTDNWSAIPKNVELSLADDLWLLHAASQLQPLGVELMDWCSTSGKNNYCGVAYSQATVNRYREDQYRNVTKSWETVLREMSIHYKRKIVGVVTATKKGEDDVE